MCVLQRFFHRLSGSQVDVNTTCGSVFQKFVFLRLHGTARYVCAVLVCLCLVASLCAQVADETSSETISTSKDVESQLVISPVGADDGAGVDDKQPSTVWLFVRMILVLVVVIICIYGVVFLLRKGMRNPPDSDPYLKVVASLALSAGKVVYVVTLKDRAYIIGVTDNAVNLIGEVNDTELIDAMNLNAESKAAGAKPRDFATILNFFHPAGKKNDSAGTESNPFAGSTEATLQVLQQQRERLHSEDSRPEEEL